MLISKPDYYEEFACTADRCIETCCAGWQIVVDEDSLKRYRRVVQTVKMRGEFRQDKESFAKRLQESVDWNEGVFYQDKERRCVFLNEHNLCDLYTALGKESLCNTCANYPRHIEEFENVREYTLSLSCPEVAMLLLSRQEPVRFLEAEEPGDEEFEDFDFLLYSQLTEARKVMLEILQNRDLNLWLRAYLIQEIAREVQEYQDEGSLFACDEIFEKFREKAQKAEPDTLEMRSWEEFGYAGSRRCFSNLWELEVLREDWEDHLKETENVLYGKEEAFYHELHENFRTWLEQNMPHYQIWLEQLMVYFVQTYFCGAVYNDYILSKAKLAVSGAWMIYEMLAARWYGNGKELAMEEVVEIVYQYSRELEHSDINLGIMDELLDEA